MNQINSYDSKLIHGAWFILFKFDLYIHIIVLCHLIFIIPCVVPYRNDEARQKFYSIDLTARNVTTNQHNLRPFFLMNSRFPRVLIGLLTKQIPILPFVHMFVSVQLYKKFYHRSSRFRRNSFQKRHLRFNVCCCSFIECDCWLCVLFFKTHVHDISASTRRTNRSCWIQFDALSNLTAES